MKVEVILSALVILLVTTIVIAIRNKVLTSCEDGEDTVHFERLYTNHDYVVTVSDSKTAGKVNSPFIPQLEMMDKLKDGTTLINEIGNMYEGVGDCDERPQW